MKAKILCLLVGVVIGQWLTISDEEVPQPITIEHTLQYDREIMHVPFARKVQEI